MYYKLIIPVLNYRVFIESLIIVRVNGIKFLNYIIYFYCLVEEGYSFYFETFLYSFPYSLGE